MSNTVFARDPSGNPIEIQADATGQLKISIDALTDKLDELIALLPTALTTAGNLKVSIEEDNTAP